MKIKANLANKATLQPYCWIAVIMAAVFVVYLPALKASLTNWDDGGYLQDNPFLQTLSWTNIKGIFTTYYMGNYHPLTMISLALDYQAGKFDPFPFHLTNLVLHLFNTILVFFAGRTLTGKINVAAMAALLFGVHPLHVESVAWVSERKDVLYTAFFLLAMLCYLRFLNSRHWVWYALTIIVFILSCLSKGQAVSFALTLVMIDLFRGRKILTPRVVAEKIPFLLLAMIFGYVAIRAQQETSATLMASFPLSQRVAFASYGLIMYLFKLVAPVSLSAYYPYPAVNAGSGIPLLYWFCILPASGVFILWWYAWKRSKILFFSLGFFLLNILFLLQLLPVGNAMMADRYVYIPSIGYCLLFGWLLFSDHFPRHKTFAFIIAAVYLVFSGFLTFERNHVWQNSMVLWTDVLDKNPHVPLAWFNRGNLHASSGDQQKAIADYTACLKEDPRYESAYINRGQSKSKLLDDAGAVADYDALLKIDPANPDAYTNRAMAKRMLKDYPAALRDYQEALRLKPRQAELYTSRGAVRFDLKDYQGALEDYNTAISLNPGNPGLYTDRALISKTMGNIAGAIADYDQALRLHPPNADLYNNRGAALFSQKKYSAALADYNSAISLNPANAGLYYARALVKKELNDLPGVNSDYKKSIELDPVYSAAIYRKATGLAAFPEVQLTWEQYYSLGQTLESQGKTEEAIGQYRKSTELKPEHAEGWYALGTAYGKTRQFHEAVHCFDEALKYKKDYVDALVNRGVIHASLGSTDMALKDLASAIALNPGSAQAYFNRAMVYLNTGKKAQACVDLKKAVSLGNTQALPIYQAACNEK